MDRIHYSMLDVDRSMFISFSFDLTDRFFGQRRGRKGEGSLLGGLGGLIDSGCKKAKLKAESSKFKAQG